MKLKNLSVRNLKGLSFEWDLDVMNVLLGDNFAGKSARTDAIRLLLLGYLPELGKTPRATFGLCSGRELYVAGTFDNGERISRRWYLKGDVVKTEDSIPAFLETSGALVAVMLNADLYFGLSERERVNYVFANIPGAAETHSQDALDQSLLAELHTADDLDEGAIATFVEEFRKDRGNADFATADPSPQEIIEWAVAWAEERAKASRTTAQVMEKTAQGLSYLRTKDTVDPAELPGVKRDEEAKAAELATLVDEKARLVFGIDAAGKSRQRRANLTATLANQPDRAKQKAGFEESIRETEAELRELTKLTRKDVEAMTATEREAAIALAGAERDLTDVQYAIEANEKELGDLEGKTVCAYCGAAGDGWKTIKRAEIESALAGLRVKVAQLVEHEKGLREFVAHEKKALEDAVRAVVIREDREIKLASARYQLDQVGQMIARLDEKKKELEALPPDDPESARKLEAVQVKIDTTRAALNQYRARVNLINGRSLELQRLAQAEKERDEAKAAAEVAKAGLVTLRWLKERVVAELFAPLLMSANAICEKVLRTPLAYHDAEIGTWRDGTWVSHRTFSGAEKRIAYVAIQAALAAKSPFRIMLLDELGTIGSENVEKVITQLAEEVRLGRIEQFVGIDVGRSKLYQSAAELEGLPLTVLRIDATVPA